MCLGSFDRVLDMPLDSAKCCIEEKGDYIRTMHRMTLDAGASPKASKSACAKKKQKHMTRSFDAKSEITRCGQCNQLRYFLARFGFF